MIALTGMARSFSSRSSGERIAIWPDSRGTNGTTASGIPNYATVNQRGEFTMRLRWMAVLLSVALPCVLKSQTPSPPTITEYGVPSSASRPNGIAKGPDGAVWFIESAASQIGRITAAGSVTEYPTLTPGSNPVGIVAGPDGNLWFTEYVSNNVCRITPAGVVTEYSVPTANSQPYFITAGPDGDLWFTEVGANKIGRITTSGAITEFATLTGTGAPTGISTGPDGAIWFTELSGNKIGRITTAASPTITEYAIPTANSSPWSITGGPDGALWFTELNSNKIGRITIAGIVTNEYAIPTPGSVPVAIALGPDSALWFAEKLAGNIARITTTGQISEYPIPTGGGWPVEIALGPDGNLWFTEYLGNNVGSVNLLPASCSLLKGISFNNSGGVGLANGNISNQQFQQLPNSNLTGNATITNNLRVWLGVNQTFSSGFLTSFSPNLDAGVEGVMAAEGLIPACASGLAGRFPYINCQSPGAAIWTAGFCGPGGVQITLSVTPSAAGVTLLDWIYPGPLDIADQVTLVQQLENAVPDFKNAMSCLSGVTATSNPFSCTTTAFSNLSANDAELQTATTILQNSGISFSGGLKAELLSLLEKPVVLTQIISDLGTLLLKTGLTGKVNLTVAAQ